VLAEGGYLVAVPALLTVLAFAWAVFSSVRSDRATGTIHFIRLGAIVGIVAVAVQEVGDFSLQIPANACLFVTLCGIALARAGHDDSSDHGNRLVGQRATMPTSQRKLIAMHECPKCKSDIIHRSRSRTRMEAWRKIITGKRLYRCHSCGWRGWTDDLMIMEALPADANIPEPPNLQSTPLARKSMHDVNLRILDETAPVEPAGKDV